MTTRTQYITALETMLASYMPLYTGLVDSFIQHSSEIRRYIDTTMSPPRISFYNLQVELVEEPRLCEEYQQDWIATIKYYKEEMEGENVYDDVQAQLDSLSATITGYDTTMGGVVDYTMIADSTSVTVLDTLDDQRIVVGEIIITSRSYRN